MLVNDYSQDPRGIFASSVIGVQGNPINVIRGITYTVVFDPYSQVSTISPNYSGESLSGDLGVNISGATSENVTVKFFLPETLHNAHGAVLHVLYPTNGPGSGVRAETGGFFNPNISNTFNLGLGKTANLRLGFVFTVPTADHDTSSFIGTIKCLVHFNNSNKSDSATFALAVKLKNSTLTIDPVNGSVTGLVRSTSYVIEYDKSISPHLNSELVTGDIGVDIKGEPTMNVLVKIDLPHALISDLGDIVYITFPSSNAGRSLRLETGGNFNPNVLSTFNLGGGGTCQLRFGYKITTPAQHGTFVSKFKVTAMYIGLTKGKASFTDTVSTIVTLTLLGNGVTPVVPELTIPYKFSLEQNYPNPFNPVTKINFFVPTSSFVTLTIIDLLGKEVTTLTSQEYHAGKYTLDWDASDQPSGMYLCRLQSGSFIETKKIILLR